MVETLMLGRKNETAPNSTTGYPANFQIGLAMAVDSGYPEGEQAWQTFSSRSMKPNYSDYPNFSIVPRSLTEQSSVIPPEEIQNPDPVQTPNEQVEVGAIIQSSSFSDALAQLKGPGQWAKIDFEFDSEFFQNGNGGHTLAWADSGKWDPHTRCIYHYGGDHLQIPVLTIYCPETGSWSRGKLPPWLDLEGSFWGYTNHGYDRNGLDRINGKLYFYRGSRMFVYNTVSTLWEKIELKYSNTYLRDGAEYFPGMGVVYGVGEKKKLYYLDVDTKENHELPNAQYYTDSEKNHTFFEYSYKYNKLIYGGGDNRFGVFILNSDGSGHRSVDSPFQIRTISSGSEGALVSEDPVSGNFVVHFTNRQIYEFNPVTENWRYIMHSPLPENFNLIVGASLPEHGVIAYLKRTSTKSCTVYLYKHK